MSQPELSHDPTNMQGRRGSLCAQDGKANGFVQNQPVCPTRLQELETIPLKKQLKRWDWRERILFLGEHLEKSWRKSTERGQARNQSGRGVPSRSGFTYTPNGR